MTKPLCIYHGNCADGFGAAWAVRAALGPEHVDFHPGIYQDPPPDVAGRDVILVDFSYKRPVLVEMATRARSILILDHHKSAAEDLADLPLPVDCGLTGPAPADWGYVDVIAGYNRDALHDCARQCNGPPVYAIFDMARSGAGLTWDFFHYGKPRPALIDHIEDRDLWRFALPGTREIQAALFSYPYDFGVWDDLMKAPVANLREEGVAIERKHHKDVAELVAATRRKMVIGGYVVPVANLPYTLSSDAGHLMCEPIDEGLAGLWIPPFAACYWDTPDGRVFSLRSRAGSPEAVDVSEIAKQYGGGGHKNAAGFRVAVGWEGDAA